jgi:glucose/mannose-6-phosphate isomerase
VLLVRLGRYLALYLYLALVRAVLAQLVVANFDHSAVDYRLVQTSHPLQSFTTNFIYNIVSTYNVSKALPLIKGRFTILDDLKLIHERDGQDTLGIAEKQWKQLAHVFTLDEQHVFGAIENIVYAAMGSSALAGLASKSWSEYTVPFEISRNYDMPSYVSKNTLVIVASYSGNTEESLSALAHAEQAGSQIAIITNGGKLAEIAKEKGYPFLVLPKVEQPRFAVLYSLKALLIMLEQAGVLKTQGVNAELAKIAEVFKLSIESWLPMTPTVHNKAKQIALDVIGKSVVLYSGPELAPAAYRWKTGFNENAKNVAWCSQYPECSHNEFIGWTSHPIEKPYAVIDIRSSFEHERVQKQFALTERLLSGRRPAPISVTAEGADTFEQQIWAILLGDFVTIYTALLNGVNPLPVALVEKFKEDMKS